MGPLAGNATGGHGDPVDQETDRSPVSLGIDTDRLGSTSQPVGEEFFQRFKGNPNQLLVGFHVELGLKPDQFDFDVIALSLGSFLALLAELEDHHQPPGHSTR